MAYTGLQEGSRDGWQNQPAGNRSGVARRLQRAPPGITIEKPDYGPFTASRASRCALRISKRDDADIATAAADRLDWDAGTPNDAVQVKVEDGWLSLSGQVDWHFQKETAEQEVRNLMGVLGVTNLITIKPRVDTVHLGDDIQHALHRSWFFDPEKVHVSADGGRVKLTGTVDTLHDRRIAAATAWAASGTTSVENDLIVA